jgi:hypothetical protein
VYDYRVEFASGMALDLVIDINEKTDLVDGIGLRSA